MSRTDMIADIQRLEKALRALEKRCGRGAVDEFCNDSSGFITRETPDGELLIEKRLTGGYPPGETATHIFNRDDGKWHPKRLRNSLGRYEPGRRS